MKRSAMCSFILLGLAACQPAASDLSEVEQAALADSINIVLEEFWGAWAETDFDRGLSYYLDSPDMAFAWGAGRSIIGYAAADSVWRPLFAAVESQQIAMEETHVNVLARDIVCVTQRGTYAPVFDGGETGPSFTFAFTTVWIRSNDEWKIVAGHQSDTDASAG